MIIINHKKKLIKKIYIYKTCSNTTTVSMTFLKGKSNLNFKIKLISTFFFKKKKN